jgi:hypothetical protein
MRVVVVFVLFLFSVAVAHAQSRNPLYGEPSDYLGTWNNVEIRRNMVVKIVIRPEYGPRVRVTVYGLRDGEPCIFGEYRGHFYVAKYPKEREQDNSAVLVRVDREFVHGHVLLRFNGRGEIVSHALLKYGDGGDVYGVERFAAGDHGYHGEGEDDYRGPRRPYYRGY